MMQIKVPKCDFGYLRNFMTTSLESTESFAFHFPTTSFACAL